MPEQIVLFHFLRPEWLWALFPLGVVLLLWYRREGKSRSWQSYCDPELLPFLMVGSEGGRSHVMMVIGGIAGLLTVIALAGPTWEQRPQPLFRSQSAMVIALDLSRSMNATDVRPNRLERAKLKLRDILARRQEGQTALIVFAGEPFVVTPLTTDTATIIALLNSIETNLIPPEAQGSHPERALGKAVALMQQGGMVQGDILLISDGTDAACGDLCIEAAAQVKEAGFRLSVISVGTSDGAPIPTAKGYLKDLDGTIVIPKLNDALLRDMARSGGGRFSPLRGDDADIDAVLSLASAISSQQMQSSDEESQQWYESGPWLLLILLPFAALFYRRGILVLPLLIMLTPKGELMAAEGDGSALWLNDNQRAERLLESGRAEEAVKLFNNQKWQAAAHYRAGNFEQSAKLLVGDQEITSQYNYANAQAKLGKFPEAIKSYEAVLAKEPAHEDARYNLELLKKMMQQQQNNKQQKPQQGDDNSDDKQGDSEQQDGEGSPSGQEGEKGESGKSDKQDSQRSGDADKPQQDSAESQQQQSRQDQGAQGEQNEQPEQQSSAQRDSESEAQAQEREQAAAGEQPKPESAGESQGSQLYQPQGDANEQWLRQIPDDPGGLLQRKFKYQYQQSYRDRERDVQPW
jgi:Ca-activated chloride channel family protein